MARTESPLKKIMFVSDYNPDHYDWNPQEQSALGDSKSTAEIIKSRLESNGISIDRMYAIEHKSEKKGELFWASTRHEKEPDFLKFQTEIRQKKHIHVLIFFSDNSPVERTRAAKIMGVSINAIDKIHTEDGCLAYLCHCKYPAKYQYKKTDVITLKGTDFSTIYDQNCQRWFASQIPKAASKTKRNNKSIFKEIIDLLISGKISYDEIFTIDEYYDVVSRTYYKVALDKQHIELLRIWRLNADKLIEKIKQDESIVDLNSIQLSNAMLLSYEQNKGDVDLELSNNLCKQIEAGNVTANMIIENQNLMELYKNHSDSINCTLSRLLLDQVKSNKITNIDEIMDNEILKNAYLKNKSEIDRYLSKKYD